MATLPVSAVIGPLLPAMFLSASRMIEGHISGDRQQPDS